VAGFEVSTSGRFSTVHRGCRRSSEETFRDLRKEVIQMHQADAVVLIILVLAGVVAIKLAPAIAGALLVALVRYRKAVR